MPKKTLAVPVAKLRKVCNPKDFSFKDTSQVQPTIRFIGQEKALEALEFGLGVDSHEHHIFATDIFSTGRNAVLRPYLGKDAARREAEGKIELHDIFSIHNFSEPNRPKILILQKGEARKLKECLDGLLDALKRKVPILPTAKEFLEREKEIMDEFIVKSEPRKRQLWDEANKAGFGLLETPAGLVPNPKMPKEEYMALSEEERRSFESKAEELTEKIDEFLKFLEIMRENSLVEIEKLKCDLVGDIMRSDFERLSRNYPQLHDYLSGLAMYILDNIDIFLPSKGQNGQNGQNGNDRFAPFKVNILIDNSATERAPIVFEKEPNFVNLFGGVEKKFVHGFFLQDHTCIKAGSLVKANGGYLVLNFWDVIKYPGVWEKLERTLKSQFLTIEEPLKNYLGIISNDLDPDPIPIKLKVIVLGSQLFYHLLAEHDPDFLGVFKTKVEFDSEMPLTSENLQSYASFVAYYCRQEDPRREKRKLIPFTPEAVAKVAEHGIRLAGKQTKLSTQFDHIKDLVVESDFWASKAGSSEVLAGHVQKALEAQKSRLNLFEEKIREAIQDGMIMVDVKGERVGQINGLAVYGSHDYSFGKPCRITARTFVGGKGVVSIQREAKMSGPIHDTGLLVLSGYFGEKYGRDKLVSFSASLCLEQSYGGIEGDSASAAELIALISSLAGIPIKQSLAMTGSVNQFGEIQPIGGVNEKIEGFFEVCKERGLTGSQGVVIPHQNVQNLMLREDVVEAVQSKTFAVYSMKTIDDAIQLLMGKNPADVHKKVDGRLTEMSEKQKPEK